MPDLNIRNVDASLMRAVKMAAVKADMTLRDWVIQALVKAVGTTDGGEAVVAAAPATRREGRFDSAPDPQKEFSKVVAGKKCFCGASLTDYVNPTTMVRKWKCTGSPAHIMTPTE